MEHRVSGFRFFIVIAAILLVGLPDRFAAGTVAPPTDAPTTRTPDAITQSPPSTAAPTTNTPDTPRPAANVTTTAKPSNVTTSTVAPDTTKAPDTTTTTHTPATSKAPAPSGSTTPTTHYASRYVQSIVRCPQLPGNTSYDILGEDYSDFRYPSTTIMYAVLSLMGFVYGTTILLRFDGIRTYSFEAGHQGERRRRRNDLTDNRRWAAFFFSLFLRYGINIIDLQVPYLDLHPEAVRIMTLLAGLLLGLSAILLVVTLIHQTTYRTKDYAASISINVKRQQQSRYVLWVCTGIYIFYIIGEFIVSHLVPLNEVGRQAFFWCFMAALLFINAPAVVSTIWVCFHQAQVQPTKVAKAFALVGIIAHFLATPPAEFWNDHVLTPWVRADPCPFHYASFFDFVLLFIVIGDSLLFIFCILEYRRNSLEVLDQEFHKAARGLNANHYSEQNYTLLDDTRSMSTYQGTSSVSPRW